MIYYLVIHIDIEKLFLNEQNNEKKVSRRVVTSGSEMDIGRGEAHGSSQYIGNILVLILMASS